MQQAGSSLAWIICAGAVWLFSPWWVTPTPPAPTVAHTVECAYEITENIRLSRLIDWWRWFALLLLVISALLLLVLAGLLWSGGLVWHTLAKRLGRVVAAVERGPTEAERGILKALRTRQAHGVLRDL